jgi:hypothetical protein
MTQLKHFIIAGAVVAALPIAGCASKSLEPCDATFARHSELANAERRSAEEHAAEARDDQPGWAAPERYHEEEERKSRERAAQHEAAAAQRARTADSKCGDFGGS